MVPAKDFDTSVRFYIELGFQPRRLTDRLVEMQLGVFSFILQDYYVREWADNFVVHVTVSDVGAWWDREPQPSCALWRQGTRPGAARLGDARRRDGSLRCSLEICRNASMTLGVTRSEQSGVGSNYEFATPAKHDWSYLIAGRPETYKKP